METQAERLKKIINSLNMRNKAFEELIGLPNGTIHNINKRGSVSMYIAKRIANYVPININWLMTGEGEMYKENAQFGNIVNITRGNNNTSAVGLGNSITIGESETVKALKLQIKLLNEYIESKDRTISYQSEIIELLKENIAILKLKQNKNYENNT